MECIASDIYDMMKLMCNEEVYTMNTVETIFSVLDTSCAVLKKELDITYLEALVETGDNVFEGNVLQSNLPTSAIERLNREYQKLSEEQYKGEEMRKAFQLCLLKGMKEGVQANHEMTPDAVGLFTGYLFHKFLKDKQHITVLDPAVGTANLLTTVFNTAPKGTTMQGYGVEVDELLLRLAFVNANLQRLGIEFFHQDGLGALYIDPVDAVICDLPVGYYPNELRAAQYQLCADTGLSYTHHLLIEQSIKHTKEGGYVFFLIPNFLFDSEQAAKLHTFLKEHTYIQGLLQLPVSMFKNEKNAKSIFVLQKKGADAKAPKQAMLAELPSFSKVQAMESMLKQIEEWFQQNK
jgi:site-specific DNA-methyltransferase (adenine-specific)